MSLFETLFDKLESKLLIGNNKQKTFVSEVKALIKGDEANAQAIWKGLEGPDGEQNASFYCMQLFNSLNNIDKKSHLAEVEEKMLSTLLILQFYKNKMPKTPELVQSSQKYQQQRNLGHLKWVTSYFLRGSCKINFVQFFMRKFIFAPRTIDWRKNISKQIMEEIKESELYSKKFRENYQNQQSQFARIKRVSYPKFYDIESKALTFGYACFTDYIRNKHLTLSLEQYQYMKQLLQAYLNAIADEHILQEYLSVLLHTIQVCITFYGCPHEEVMKDMLVWANQIRLLPGKLSQEGDNFFNLLLKELKIHGAAFRHQLKRDFPCLTQKEVKISRKQYYFVTNSQDFVSQPDQVSLINLRKNIILHSLKISQVEQYRISQFALFLDHLPELQIFTCYEKAIKILEIASSFESYEKIKKIQKESLEQLMRLTKEKNHKKQLDEYGGQYKKNYGHGLQNFKKENCSNFCSYQNIKEHPLGFFQYPKHKIVYLTLTNFLDEKGNLNFKTIVKKFQQQYNKNANNSMKNKLPIIFYGKRDQFFRFIRPFGDYYQKTPVSQLVNIKLFYISKPNLTHRPSIANYISNNDILYRRIIMNSFEQKLIYPYIEPKSINRDTLPITLMNKYLHHYLRQANYTFNLQLFKCHIKRQGIENRLLEEHVYFSQAVTLGLFSEAEIIKLGKIADLKHGKDQKYYNKQLVEIIVSKLKKFQYYTVEMEIQYFQSISNEYHTRKEQLKVDDIQICNAPREYFIGKKPNPSKPYLELTVLTANNDKLFRKQISNSYNFKEKRDISEILLAFQDLLIQMTIKTIKIENMQKQRPLRLMIDGTLFQGIHSFEIQPVISVDNRLVRLPIQTFLPFS